MPDLQTLALFVAAALLLLIVPGPAVLYVVARTIDQGRLAGFVSILGISLGTLAHVAAAAFGVSAILASSAVAFNVMKYLGAAYLIVLGIRKLMERDDAERPVIVERQKLGRIFWQGAVVNLLNPKTALFFFAFLPQFVDVDRGAIASQILFLGAVFVVLAVLSDGLWALLADAVAGWVTGSKRFLKAQRVFAGGTFIALGVATAFSGARSK
ncbi:MAG: LysE family translocator [Acidobacteriota bacterium]